MGKAWGGRGGGGDRGCRNYKNGGSFFPCCFFSFCGGGGGDFTAADSRGNTLSPDAQENSKIIPLKFRVEYPWSKYRKDGKKHSKKRLPGTTGIQEVPHTSQRVGRKKSGT